MLLSPQAYQSFARECIQWAEQTTDLTTRAAFLSLARDWTLAAQAMPERIYPSAHRPRPASATREP